MINPSEIKAAVDLLRDLYNYVKQSANYDPKIIESLEAIRTKVLDAREKEIELLEQVHGLRETLKMKTMPFDRNIQAYYENEEDGQRIYYCLRCADADEKNANFRNIIHAASFAACAGINIHQRMMLRKQEPKMKWKKPIAREKR